MDADPTLAPPVQDVATADSLALLSRARAGDSPALDELLRRYLPRLKKWVTRRLPVGRRGLADTDDLVQDTIINVLGVLPAFEVRHEAGLQAYFRQAIWNRLREEIRSGARQGAQVELDDTHAAWEPSALEQAIGSQALARYEDGLLQLSEDERSAIVGRLELGYSYPELALMLGRRTPDAVRKLVERALPRLAEWMRDVR